MGFITEEEAIKRLESGDNLLTRLGQRSGSNSMIEESSEVIPGVPDSDDDDVADNNVDEALRRAALSGETDPVRIAVLAARRETKSSKHRGGRYPGQPNLPSEFRALVGAAARIGTTRSVAEATGLGLLAVHNYKNGKTCNAASPSATMLEQIEEKTLGIRDQVLGILSYTVAGITRESLENKDPKELSIIARNLSSVMSSTKPPADFGDKTTNAQVIVFSPEQEKEAAYDTVDVG
jgi:hypothetical protein